MEITTAQFIKGIRGTDPILEQPYPQIAFIGRSNVGKSSSINALLGRNKLVKSSSRPGKTQQINFFFVNESFYFVDLPGYGYAKLSHKERDKLSKLINWYLFDAGVQNRTVVLVIDARIGMTDLDKNMMNGLIQYQVSCVILANKSDKLNQKEKLELSEALQSYGVPVISFSALKKRGIEDFYQAVIR